MAHVLLHPLHNTSCGTFLLVPLFRILFNGGHYSIGFATPQFHPLISPSMRWSCRLSPLPSTLTALKDPAAPQRWLTSQFLLPASHQAPGKTDSSSTRSNHPLGKKWQREHQSPGVASPGQRGLRRTGVRPQGEDPGARGGDRGGLA